MDALSLDAAQRMIEGAFRKGAEMKFKPLAAAILDVRGCLKAFALQDGHVALLRSDIAQAKAYGVLALGVGGRAIRKRAAETPAFIASATALADGRLVPVPGGVLIQNAQGDVVGAIGVSGDTSDNDEICAIAGIEGAGFKADPG